MMSTITSLTGTAATTSQSSGQSTATDALGKDDFLKLLITQLGHQDPMNPMEDQEFIAQMAQFSALEQMQNLSSSTQITQATSFIGKDISWGDDNGVLQTGTVTSVKIANGEPSLVVGTATVALNKVLTIQETAAKG